MHSRVLVIYLALLLTTLGLHIFKPSLIAQLFGVFLCFIFGLEDKGHERLELVFWLFNVVYCQPGKRQSFTKE